jgi:hypothetical protein
MISGHAYRANGLGAQDENGNIPCAQCGLSRGTHTSERPGPAPGARIRQALADCLRMQEAQLETDLAGIRHRIQLATSLPDEGDARGTH